MEATPQEQASAETTVEAEEPTAEEKLQKELDDTKAELEKSKKEYMFLLAEFDNFRKRTLKEKVGTHQKCRRRRNEGFAAGARGSFQVWSPAAHHR